MPFGGQNSERALIIAPRGRDAEIASKLLQEAGWPTLICADIANWCAELKNGAAFSVVVEEVLIAGDPTCIAEWIAAQPPWSDFPIVVLTSHGSDPGRQTIADRLLDTLGNVSFLERPFHPSTLISVARSALRSRRRQYQAREMLERHGLLAAELQHRTKNLLAVIQAVASASLDESQGRTAFFSRLHALAAAQDLIIDGAGRGALLKVVVGKAIESFAGRVLDRRARGFSQPQCCPGLCAYPSRIDYERYQTRRLEDRCRNRIGALVIRCHFRGARHPLSMARTRWATGCATEAKRFRKSSARTRNRRCRGPTTF